MTKHVAFGLALLLPLAPVYAQERAACTAAAVFPKLDEAYHRCVAGRSAKTDWDCDSFVSEIRKTLQWQTCPAPFWEGSVTTDPSPMLWSLGDPNPTDYVELLSKLPSHEARCLFTSKKFRDALSVTSDLAEEFDWKVRRAAKLLRGKCNER